MVMCLERNPEDRPGTSNFVSHFVALAVLLCPRAFQRVCLLSCHAPSSLWHVLLLLPFSLDFQRITEILDSDSPEEEAGVSAPMFNLGGRCSEKPLTLSHLLRVLKLMHTYTRIHTPNTHTHKTFWPAPAPYAFVFFFTRSVMSHSSCFPARAVLAHSLDLPFPPAAVLFLRP